MAPPTVPVSALVEIHTHPYEYTYANPTPMSTSEGLSTGRSRDSRSHQWRLVTGRSRDSRSHQWRLVVDGNIAYHLTYNARKSWKNPGKGASTRIWTLVGSVPLDHPTIRLRAQSCAGWNFIAFSLPNIFMFRQVQQKICLVFCLLLNGTKLFFGQSPG
jgi:hypothetical protein